MEEVDEGVLCLRVKVKPGSKQHLHVRLWGEGGRGAQEPSHAGHSSGPSLASSAFQPGRAFSLIVQNLYLRGATPVELFKRSDPQPHWNSRITHLTKNQNTILQNSQPGMTLRVWGPLVCPDRGVDPSLQ